MPRVYIKIGDIYSVSTDEKLTVKDGDGKVIEEYDYHYQGN